MSRSLNFRIVLPIVTIVVVGGVIIGLAGATYGGRVLSETQVAHARDLATTTLDSVRLVMRQPHGDELGSLLQEFAANENISAMRILTPDGKVRLSSAPAEIGSTLPAHATAAARQIRPWLSLGPWSQPTLLHTVAPIPNDVQCTPCHRDAGDLLGLLDIDVDISHEATVLQSWWHLNGILADVEGLLVVLVAATALILLQLVVIRPLRRLAAAMDRVNCCDEGASFTAHGEPGGSREVDDLVAGFNAMVVRLREGSQAMETARQLQLERAEQLATVGQMAAGLAHEIRNPLSGVQAAMQLLAAQLESDPRKHDVAVRSMVELRRIEQTLRALLDYARPRAPALERSDLNATVANTISLVRPDVEMHGIVLEWSPAPNLPAVSLDAPMIHQIVLNLVINAVHAIGAGNGGSIRVTTEARLDGVVCRVKDTGPGVRKAVEEKIFGAFFTTKTHGTGLGLAISRRLVELHGGRLMLENPDEAGASFVFVLPLAGSRAAVAVDSQAVAQASLGVAIGGSA